ncbi:MAG TPA: hypothetical protein PK370_00515 [Candidatus Woesebacteria bacterium]|nr:hypothetical protein [Candidatus Woesebacteria bacterium]HPJ17159.1 hypothetical protein [Candidatus Woesebacteria bacterium]
MKKLFFSWLIFFGCSVPVLAESGLTLVTSPLPINLVAAPGSSVSAEIKIKNGGKDTEKLKVGLMKFSAYNQDGQPRLFDREKGDDYFDWVSFSENKFELESNEWKTIEMKIEVPDDAAFGYYYAVVFSRDEEYIPDGNKTTKIVGATACLVLLEVRVDRAIREIEIEEFMADKKVYEFLPTNFLIKLKNKGNVHVAPRGNIFITDSKGKDVSVIEVNEFRGNILPQSIRNFETNWTDGFPRYENKKLKWDFTKINKLRIGKYKASMLLAYDDGKRDVPIEAVLSFWVIPYRIIGGIVVVSSLILVGLSSLIISIIKIFKK